MIASTRGLDARGYARHMRIRRRAGRPCEHPRMACWRKTLLDPEVSGGVAQITTCQDCGATTREHKLYGGPVWGA